jgi:GWxTD domain-containing protein
MWKALVAGTLAVLTLYAAERTPEDKTGVRSTGNGPQFRAQIGERLSSNDDSLRLFVAVSVPYDNLIFLRSDSGFAATFQLVTSVFREGTGLVSERISNVQVESLTYAETNSRTKHAAHSDEFLVSPGDYTVKVTMSSESEPKRKSKWEGKLPLAALDSLLRVSDVYWLQEDTALSSAGMPRLVESFYTTEDSAHARLQIFSKGRDPIRLLWTVAGDKSDTVQTERRDISPTGDVQTSDFVVHVRSLLPQTYTLRVIAEGNGRREERERRFGIRLPGVPPSITNLDEAIRQLKYIATSEESKRLRNASPRERPEVFRSFWQKRDPTPKTEENELMDEYYFRVQFAQENFSTNREGWETDRGRIYIIYGPPTDIERHPFEADSRPYEVWYYSQIARKFIFVDYTGFGDYTLAGPEWGY